MADSHGQIYIGSILLEINRWAPGKRPSYRVSDWLSRFQQAGFDGIELWENHAALAPAEELEALERSPVPVTIFNSYAGLDDGSEPDRKQAAALAGRLGAKGVKFNTGNDPSLRQAYLRNARGWRPLFPAGTRLLCECHAGTLMEEPQAARAMFAHLEPEGFEAIVHPFTTEPDQLKAWFACLGPRITHAHVQIRDANNQMLRLDQAPARVAEALAVMRDANFRGSWTLEFAAGTRTPGESMEGLFEAALADLHYLKERLWS